MNKYDGPIVAAVREARAKIISACNHDFEQLAKRLREIEAAHVGQVARPKSRRGDLRKVRLQP